MLVNLLDVLTSEGKRREARVPIALEQISYSGAVYPVTNRPQAALVFTNIGMNKVLIEGHAEVVLEMPCDRCLQAVAIPLELRFMHKAALAEDMPDSGTEASTDDEFPFMEGSQLNTEELIYHEIIINLPSKVLCTEDCKGICRECGQNLNERECGCDTFIPDPRMAAVKDIFYTHKEV